MKKARIIFSIDLLRALYTGYNNVKQENDEEVEQQNTIQFKQQTVSWKGYVGVGLLVIGSVFLILGRKKSNTKA